MRIYIGIILILAQLIVTNVSHASGVNQVSNFTIKINPAALDETSGEFADMSKPFCLTYDSRNSIGHPYYTNPSPLPRLKVSSCVNGSSDQNYSFFKNKIYSNGECLTRLNKNNVYSEEIEELIADRRSCYNANYDDFMTGSYSQTRIYYDLAMRPCDGSSNQYWDITVNDNNNYQLAAGSSCLSASGSAADMYISRSTTIICGGYIITNPKITVHDNIFQLEMKSCSDASTKYNFERDFIILEKTVPLIIPIPM